MRNLLLVTVLGLGAIAGCSKSKASEGAATTEAAKIAAVSIDQLDTMLASGQCTAVDANGDATRKKMGVIPKAILLKDSDAFDASQLPADKQKPLVFYCANTHCGASHEAAASAIAAGYKDVKVLPDGIAGWVQAGKKVDQI